MNIVHKVSAWTLIGLGILHTSLTPLFYSGFTVDALWFAGTGLGILFLGSFNLAILRAHVLRTLCLIANLIGSVYGILIVIVLPEPQAFLALLAFLGATIGCISIRKSNE
jgi:hypothetical protein